MLIKPVAVRVGVMHLRVRRPAPDAAQVLQGVGCVVGVEAGLVFEIGLQRVAFVPFRAAAPAPVAGRVVDDLHGAKLHVNAAQAGRLGVTDFVAHLRLQSQGVEQRRQFILGIEAVKRSAKAEDSAPAHRLDALVELDAGAAGPLLAEGGELRLVEIIFAPGQMLAGFVQIPGPVARLGGVQNGGVDDFVPDRIVARGILKIDVAHEQRAAIDQPKHAAGRAELVEVLAGMELTRQLAAVIDPVPVAAVKVPPAAGGDRFYQAAEQPLE